MSAAIEKVASFLSRQKISGSLLLAVSGGIDSSAMAHVIFELRNSFKKIGVAHVNFHLRGEDSDRDQEFVRNLSRQYGFEFYTADFDTNAYAKEHKLSVEIAARQLRYSWFQDLAKKEGFDFLLTAHNANDNAETLLLNLVRGTGRLGLGAIRPYGPLGDSLNVARPLLEVERSEIEEYVRENKLEYCIDRTNSQNEYSRNKIRNQVIPLLQEINPSVIRTLTKDIERFRVVNSELDSLCQHQLESFIIGENSFERSSIISSLRNRFLIFRADLNRIAGAGNMLFWFSELLRKFGIPFNEDSLEEISQAVRSYISEGDDHTSKTVLLNGFLAEVERNELRVYDAICQNRDLEEIAVKSCGSYNFGPYSIEIEKRNAEGFDIQDSVRNGFSVLDASKVSFPLTLSTMQPGDRFSPFGLRGSKSVADFLNSRKVDLLFKDIIPIIKDKDGKIVCLPSLEIDDCFRVTSHSNRILIVSVSLK